MTELTLVRSSTSSLAPVVLALWCATVGCAGESSKSAKGPEGTSNTASGNAAAGGGAATQTSTAGTAEPSSNTSAGGTANTGASGETSGGGGNGVMCSGPPRACVPGCGSSETVMQTCRDGAWSCPSNHTLLTDCPLDSCARGEASCCNDATGNIVQPPCGADDKFEACPTGTRQLGPSYDCIPEDTGATECTELSGPCASDELRCVSGGLWFCGTLCACTPDGAGTLSWQCEQVTCP